jgi:ribose-phosphate pyrophosphokinase
MLQVAGANRILTMDLHQGQLQGFFNVPVDELTAVHMLSNYIRQKGTENLAVVTDLGFAKRARTFAELLDAPLAIVEKRREGNDDHAEVLNVIGDVKGKRVVIVDDEIDTGGTLTETVRAIEKAGAIEVIACATHGVFSGPAIERINASSVQEVIVTDSIPMPAGLSSPKIKRLSSAPLFGEAIKRIHLGESVGALFGKEASMAEEMVFWDGEHAGLPSTTNGNGRAAIGAAGAKRRAK